MDNINGFEMRGHWLRLVLTLRSHTDCSDSRSGRRKAPLYCPMIFEQESTVSESVWASEPVRVIAIDSKGVICVGAGCAIWIRRMKYLSEGGGLNVKRGADCGAAEEREEGRG